MASREFHGNIVNQSDNPLFWSDDSVDSGVWQDPWYPSKVPGAGKIDPGHEAEWRSESDGILTGTSGWARWGIRVVAPFDPEPDHFEWVQVNWSLDYFNGGHLQDCTFGVTRNDPKDADAFAKPDTLPPVLEIVPARRNADGTVTAFSTDGAGKAEELIGLALLPLGYFLTDVINGNLEHARVDFIVRRRASAQQASTAEQPARGIIYAVNPVVPAKLRLTGGVTRASGGALKWFHHLGIDTGSFTWEGPRQVGTGWGGFKQLFSGGAGIIYGITPVKPATGPTGIGPSEHGHPASGGDLLWYCHAGREDGTFAWTGPMVVGKGWGDLQHVFADGEGFIYGVTPLTFALPSTTTIDGGGQSHAASGGDLMWFHHLGREDGSFRWEGPKKVGAGWRGLKQIFPGGGGVIYAVTGDGDLMWYRHLGRDDGSFRWDGPKKVGVGWGNLNHLFSAGNGVIYGITPEKDLVWFHHDGYADGSFRWGAATGRKVGVGWDIATVFAD